MAPDLPWEVLLAGEQAHADPAHRGGGVRRARGVGRLPTPALAQLYARAAIYALPARYEPFGLTVLEAALSGCALVLGDIPSLRENWEGAALFVDPGSPDGLREALAGLVRDAGRRAQLGRLALARGLLFDPARMASAYLAAYLQLLAGVPAQRGAAAPTSASRA